MCIFVCLPYFWLVWSKSSALVETIQLFKVILWSQNICALILLLGFNASICLSLIDCNSKRHYFHFVLYSGLQSLYRPSDLNRNTFFFIAFIHHAHCSAYGAKSLCWIHHQLVCQVWEIRCDEWVMDLTVAVLAGYQLMIYVLVASERVSDNASFSHFK